MPNDLPKFWPTDSDWTPLLQPCFQTKAWSELDRYVDEQRHLHTVYPEPENVFRAFQFPGYRETKVVILGQDPYHGEGQAHGLSFSVEGPVKLPPSLRNIFRELMSDLNVGQPSSGNLDSWARAGVLLLNSVLTVNRGDANSHKNRGWESFTDRVIEILNDHPSPLVFMLWGKSAQAKSTLISERHRLIVSPHPSPFSAHLGFFGSKPFSRANKALESLGRGAIRWEF